MKKVKVIVEVISTKTLVIDLEENEVAKLKARDIIDEMTDEEYEKFLKSCQHDVYVEEMTLDAQVKEAIDSFDPYVLLPGVDAPFDEYYGESRRIVEKIESNMSKEEIADIIAKEFTRSFNREFTIENCLSPAVEIHQYLMNQGRSSN